MTVQELKTQLAFCNDDAEIILNCDMIHGAQIKQGFSIQTNDYDDNSPIFFEFSLDCEVCRSGY